MRDAPLSMAGTCSSSSSNLVSSSHHKVCACSSSRLARFRSRKLLLNRSSTAAAAAAAAAAALIKTSSILRRKWVRPASVAEGTSSPTVATSPTAVTQEVEVSFTWKGQASEVLLSGDFVDWQQKIPLVKTADGAFQVKQKLAPGVYKLKFVVDGEWMHSPDYPTTPDGTGGLNNEVTVLAPGNAAATDDGTQAKAASEASSEVKEKPAAAKPKPKAKPAAKKKPVEKQLPEFMIEDVIPELKSLLEKEDGVQNVEISFEDNQLQGTFSKGNVPYSFWAFYPDGTLDGARGFSISTHGAPPSTIEPFLIDEKKRTAQTLVFWLHKRLSAQGVFT